MLSTFLRVFILLLATVIAVQAQTRLHEGAKIFEIKLKHTQQLVLFQSLTKDDKYDKQMELLDYSFYLRGMESKAHVLVQSSSLEMFENQLKKHGIAYKITNENFRATIERDLNTQRLLKALKPYVRNQRLGTERYYSHGEINQYIEDLAKRFPQRVYVKTVGKSYEGRRMKTIKITNGDGRQNKQVVLMDGGFHAREWISPAAAVYIIGELVENFSANSELLKDYDWIVLPVVNPDGYEYTQLSADTRMWRKTRQPSLWNGSVVECYGTDPNRNFDFHWRESGASADPCSNTYAGPKAFSEPEAVVVRDLIHTYKQRGVMYLTLHSAGSMLLYPWGWTSDLPDTWPDLHEVGTAGADAIYKHNGTQYVVGSSTNVLYVAAGASDDYAFQAGFPQSFTMELPAGGPNRFDPPPSLIDSYVKETWVGIRAMAKKLYDMYPLLK